MSHLCDSAQDTPLLLLPNAPPKRVTLAPLCVLRVSFFKPRSGPPSFKPGKSVWTPGETINPLLVPPGHPGHTPTLAWRHSLTFPCFLVYFSRL